MRKQLQGISFILFGILLALFAFVDLWIPILDSVLSMVAGYACLVFGIIGLILALRKE